MFWRIIMVLLLGVLAAAYFGKQYMDEQMAEFMAAMPMPPSTVTAETVTTGVWTDSITTLGSAKELDGTFISSDVAGKVSKLHFVSGRVVKKGDLLIELETDVDVARIASLRADLRLAQQELNRIRKLFQRKSVSKADLDRAQSAAQRSKSELAAQQALIDQKTIRAPFDGVLGITDLDVGEYVTPGQPLVRLVNLDPILITLRLPEAELARIHVGQKFDLTTEVWPDKAFTGSIAAIESTIDLNTRNVLMIGYADNPDQLLKSGMTVKAKIALPGQRQVVLLPQTAVAYNPYGNVVYVITEQDRPPAAPMPEMFIDKDNPMPPPSPTMLVANQRFVKLGERQGDMVIVESGLEPGDQVVTAGAHKLRNGAEVVIDDKTKPPSSLTPTPENS